ncbi:chemotaxis protein [Rhizobium sp. Leaf384]|uniref:methyl-accepting chemotaxis protein n=1 Tax=unclassified Rhizobium TaxID=2613769 RepID=UPI0007122F02|nr:MULTISPECIES: methyl-accepting chemotaxis protein [unclassified Rhizobium]KQS79555.1 chemotaxis protein [Rhizobium sp. Leaf384]KQS82973.1 chemotaxis protein [Rhizobium sp. Leaf383]
MSFIDRLLQSRRIVTKVLLFVVPLVLLIAGVGLAGFFTSTMLNGHMTVTRATIENIGDFDSLQSAMQEMTLRPNEATLSALNQAIDRQKKGVEVLDGLLSSEDRRRIDAVLQLAPAIRSRTEALWAIKSQRDANGSDIAARLTAIKATAGEVNQKLGNLRKKFDGQEKFAKSALFDAFAYASITERLTSLRSAVANAASDDATSKAATSQAGALLAEFDVVKPLVAPKVMAGLEPVRAAAERLLTAAGAKGAADAATLAQDLKREAGDLDPLSVDLQTKMLKSSAAAADRFVKLEPDVKMLQQLLTEVGSSLALVDALQLHIERLSAQLTEAARDVVLADIAALRASSQKVAELGSKNETMSAFSRKLEPELAAVKSAASAMLVIETNWNTARTAASDTLSAGMENLHGFISQAQETGKEDSERSAHLSVVAMVLGTILAIVGGVMLVETLRAPLKRVTNVMKRLAEGDLDVGIEGRDRGDEIGDMVRSVSVFRDNARENIRLEQEAAAVRARSDAETARAMQERARIAAEQEQALTALSDVLDRLANGDLQQALREDLPDDFIDMAKAYNTATQALRSTLLDVRTTTSEISDSAGNLSASADDLARRTEQQAAALEHSSRALRHLDTLVGSTADSARKTAVAVNETEQFAVRSGEVVARAVGAMGEISASSSRIATIIGVIDEIAFQTNLLALNAGVEAARAGEAGRGFAVVAQEVRELAQRCAGAAREIKGLISASAVQVESGVHLVEETGQALSRIIAHVTDVRKLVATISSATGEQSTGISDVSEAVQSVERITQQNAAMVEENNAEIHGLRQRVEILADKVDRFRVDHSPSLQGVRIRRAS